MKLWLRLAEILKSHLGLYRSLETIFQSHMQSLITILLMSTVQDWTSLHFLERVLLVYCIMKTIILLNKRRLSVCLTAYLNAETKPKSHFMFNWQVCLRIITFPQLVLKSTPNMKMISSLDCSPDKFYSLRKQMSVWNSLL